MKTHKHKFSRKHSGRRGLKELFFRCTVEGCKEGMKRPMTAREKKRIRAQQRAEEKFANQQNKVWWEFCKKVMGMPEATSGSQHDKLKVMSAAEKMAKKYPDDIFICGIDDDHFASSDFIMVLHRVKQRLWGTSVVVVTQCDPQPPLKFFMYPGHASGIQAILEHLGRFKDTDPKRERMIKKLMKKDKKFARIMNRKPWRPKMPRARRK